jgi:hypothetical protein
MKKFHPYVIHHIELNDSTVSPKFDVTVGNYIVFWWNEIGLGQHFIDPNQSVTKSEYDELLISAIKPSIVFYTKDLINGNNDWEHWIKHDMHDDWKEWMKTVFSKFTAAPVPLIVPVSVVVCTHNRPAQLEKCLTALNKLKCMPEEIVVVDNAPSDDLTFHEHRKELKVLKKQLFYYMRGFTTAALIQQNQHPEAGYIRHRLRQFPRYYWNLILKDFPHNTLRFKTSVEIFGIIAGLKYYHRNYNRFF